jgi:hypothetical protein
LQGLDVELRISELRDHAALVGAGVRWFETHNGGELAPSSKDQLQSDPVPVAFLSRLRTEKTAIRQAASRPADGLTNSKPQDLLGHEKSQQRFISTCVQ